MKKLINDHDGIQFSHTFDEQIGGQLKAGFVITGAYEDYNNDEIADGILTFWATRAIKGTSKNPGWVFRGASEKIAN